MPNQTFANLVARLTNVLKAKRLEYQNFMVQHIVAATIVPLLKNSIPTHAEMLSEVLKLYRELTKLANEIESKRRTVWIEMDFERTREYWRKQRSTVDACLYPHIDKLLSVTLEERMRRELYSKLGSGLEDFLYKHENLKTVRLDWDNFFVQVLLRDYQVSCRKFERQLLEGTEIPLEIKEELRKGVLDGLFPPDLSGWNEACMAVASLLMPETGEVFLNGQYYMSLARASEAISKNPANYAKSLVAALPIDQAIEESRATYALWKSEGSVGMSPPLLCYHLKSFRKNSSKESLIRFFSELGLNILKDADQVFVRRDHLDYSAVYWLFGCEASTVVFCVSSESMFDCVYVFSGSVAAAETWIKAKYCPVRTWSDSENREEYLGTSEPAPPETPKNIAVALDPERGLDYVKSRLAVIG